MIDIYKLALHLFVSRKRFTNSFHGHLDYSFASARNLDDRTLVTRNQDKACKVSNVHNLSNCIGWQRRSHQVDSLHTQWKSMAMTNTRSSSTSLMSGVGIAGAGLLW
jgi:mRNA deadenylase 3'-5' endonuclease subunit Ccr4